MSTGLWLVGLGPGALSQMTQAAISAARACEHRFLEGYTASLPADQEQELAELVGPWTRLMRPDVEDPEELLRLAAESSVALLVVGDPLQATTHVDLQLRCHAAGIACDVVHGLSITTVVTGAVGLQSYRFGRQVTLPYPHGEVVPTSPLEFIIANRDRGLHTLVLLDLDPTGMGVEEQTPMSPEAAVDVLLRMAEELGVDVGDWTGVLCSDVGGSDQRIIHGTLDRIASVSGGRIHCLVIPGRLDDLESEALSRWRV